MSVTKQKKPAAGGSRKNPITPVRNRDRTSSLDRKTVNFDVAQVCGIEARIRMTQQEAELLYVLFQQAGQVIAERELVETAWKREYEETDMHRMVMYFRRIRKMLRENNLPLDLRRQRWFSSVGYRLVSRDR